MSEQPKSDVKTKKSKTTAVTSFIFGLAFWIPLLNLIFGFLAILIGIKSLISIRKNPDKYGGNTYAIAGIVLGFLVYATYLTGLGMCLYGNKQICTTMGLSFLA